MPLSGLEKVSIRGDGPLRGGRLKQRGRETLGQLTQREQDVLRQVGQGATNAEVAAALHVSEATVKTHLGNILTKLGLRDRAAAIVFAHNHDLV